MECELWRLIELSQAGDSECTLQLVSQFSPLLKKYSRRLRVEDSYEILQSCLLELIARMDIKRLSCCTNGVIIKYIEKTLLHQYIALSRDARKITTVLTEDLSEHDFFEYDLRFSNKDEYISLLLRDMQSVLSPTEYRILFSLFIKQYSVSETALQLNVTRQSVNQTKNRALRKLKIAWRHQ